MSKLIFAQLNCRLLLENVKRRHLELRVKHQQTVHSVLYDHIHILLYFKITIIWFNIS